MKVKIFIVMLVLANQLMAQQIQYKPTKSDIDSIYSSIKKEQIEKFLCKNPVLEDISEAARDSIFLMLINNYRVSKGLNMLYYVPALDSACELHTNWMLMVQKVEHDETSFNVDGKMYNKFTDRIRRFDSYWLSNHNILFENCGGANSSLGNDPTIQFKRITSEHVYEIFNAWKASPGHNAAMLNASVRYLGFYLGSKFNPQQNYHIVLGTLIVSN